MCCGFGRTLSVVLLLTVCLMTAPLRRAAQGDRSISASPTLESHVGPEPGGDGSAGVDFGKLCAEQPLTALSTSIREYRTHVQGYTCRFIKQERIGGKLRGEEVIACSFQESPFAVLMKWISGKDRASAMMYVRGENDDRLMIVPAAEAARKVLALTGKHYASRSLDSSDAKSASRSPADQFGILNAAAKARDVWQQAADGKSLCVKYLGVKSLPGDTGVSCHVMHRIIAVADEEGLTDVYIYLDSETKLLRGMMLKAGDELIASYQYADLRLNPPFRADQFRPSALKD